MTATITVYLSNSIKVLKLLSQIFFVDTLADEQNVYFAMFLNMKSALVQKLLCYKNYLENLACLLPA